MFMILSCIHRITFTCKIEWKRKRLEIIVPRYVSLGCNKYSVRRLVIKAYALRISKKTSLLVGTISNFGGLYLYALSNFYVIYWWFFEVYLAFLKIGCLKKKDRKWSLLFGTDHICNCYPFNIQVHKIGLFILITQFIVNTVLLNPYTRFHYTQTRFTSLGRNIEKYT